MYYNILSEGARGTGWVVQFTIFNDDDTIFESNIEHYSPAQLTTPELDNLVSNIYNDIWTARNTLHYVPSASGSDIIKSIDIRKEMLKKDCIEYMQANPSNTYTDFITDKAYDWKDNPMVDTLLYEYANMAVRKEYIEADLTSIEDCYNTLNTIVQNSTMEQLVEMLRS